MKRTLTFWLLLAMLLQVTACAASAKTFTDVPADASYAQAVAWCAENGLMNGVDSASFAPDDSMTRAMLATILYRQAGEPQVTGGPEFADALPGVWYSSAVTWAAECNLLRGYGNGIFGVNDAVSREMLDIVIRRQNGEDPAWTGDPALAANATRAEAAVALYQAFFLHEPTTPPEGSILVVYFSAQGHTRPVAEKVAEVTGGDLFELVPTEPYTADDLNYHNSSCRANQEQNDPAARPAIRNLVDSLDSYDTVFIGYPIWHGQPPKIIHTFLESCDLSGKTIAAFCTSGGSGHNDSPLRPLAPDATWLTGQRFASADEVQSWIDGLELPTASKQSESSENPSDQMYVQIGATVWTATLEQNASVTQWKELLAQGPLTIDMSDYGGFEKVGPIGADLTQSNRQITTQPGDIILYQGNRITIYYGVNSWNFTPLGHLDDVSETELLDVLQAGGGDITVTFSLTNPEGA